MGKILLAADYGSTFPGSYHDRFDPVLIEAVQRLVQLRNTFERTEKYRAACDELEARITARFTELGVDPEDVPSLQVAQLDSGTRFTIRDYDGAEFLITEHNLLHFMP
jgi:hypothetical protein